METSSSLYYKKFSMRWSYYYANSLRELVTDKSKVGVETLKFTLDSLNMIEDIIIFIIDNKNRPTKRTTIHFFLEALINEEINQLSHYNYPEGTLEDWGNVLEDYGVKFDKVKDIYALNLEDYERYGDSIANILQKDIVPQIANESFTLLFADKPFLYKFNLFISEYVISPNISRFATYLNNNKLKRSKHFPIWIKRAIFYRDRGLCSYCKKDLSGILNISNLIHLDHIIPLYEFGSNDSSNFQLTCASCNLDKNKKLREDLSLFPVYW